MKKKLAIAMCAAALLAVTAGRAQEAAGVGFRGWGPRVGAQSDLDRKSVV